ncbi:hypothetical protein CTN02_04520 [Lysinibacillus sphaericus]|nr:hypothetical protein CTN02_04520 [Lysinibacillus sphaericus]
MNIIKPDKPNSLAKRIIQILGSHFGELRTMMQYFFQSSYFRGIFLLSKASIQSEKM